MLIPTQCDKSILPKTETDRMIGVFMINFEKFYKLF